MKYMIVLLVSIMSVSYAENQEQEDVKRKTFYNVKNYYEEESIKNVVLFAEEGDIKYETLDAKSKKAFDHLLEHYSDYVSVKDGNVVFELVDRETADDIKDVYKSMMNTDGLDSAGFELPRNFYVPQYGLKVIDGDKVCVLKSDDLIRLLKGNYFTLYFKDNKAYNKTDNVRIEVRCDNVYQTEIVDFLRENI